MHASRVPGSARGIVLFSRRTTVIGAVVVLGGLVSLLVWRLDATGGPAALACARRSIANSLAVDRKQVDAILSFGRPPSFTPISGSATPPSAFVAWTTRLAPRPAAHALADWLRSWSGVQNIRGFRGQGTTSFRVVATSTRTDARFSFDVRRPSHPNGAIRVMGFITNGAPEC